MTHTAKSITKLAGMTPSEGEPIDTCSHLDQGNQIACPAIQMP
jgi:hypothetical protein